MSLQTNVFENGRWVTRSVDPYHVRAQNSRSEASKPPLSSKLSAKAPSLGLLSRVIVRSSLTKQIIPAKLRHEKKHDLVFVSSDYIAIKEILEDCSLKDVGEKSDFDSPIRLARTIGHTWETERDRHTQTTGPFAASDEKAEQSESLDEEETLDSSSVLPNKLPPHILVLVLASAQLVFLCSLDDHADNLRLLCSHHPLPAARSCTQQVGEHLAVDPKYDAPHDSEHLID
ncbi:hypothetical protein ACLMJK_001771 [Lecanora helva]